jgi:hypothetical protein
LRLSALLLAAFVVAGCASAAHVAAQQRSRTRLPTKPAAKALEPKFGIAQRALRLPPIPRGPLPGYLLIADRASSSSGAARTPSTR